MKTNKLKILSLWLLPMLILAATIIGGFALVRYGPANLDTTLLPWFRDSSDSARLTSPEWVTAFWRGLTWLGDTTQLIVLAVLAIFGMLYLRRWFNALFITGIMLSGIALSTLLKHWIARPRPQLVAHLDHVSSPSFPSGHALNNTLFYLTMALLLVPMLRRQISRWALYTSAISLSLMIGISRIALGVHWPSDVLAGWIIATAWLGLWIMLARYYWPKTQL
ncbi:MAG: phosphatase PAP2 family protein [Gammaproteobacteria bacterium]|nr:phosphatase PAP2 family protein [Gammaproteobacteria bacterium]